MFGLILMKLLLQMSGYKIFNAAANVDISMMTAGRHSLTKTIISVPRVQYYITRKLSIVFQGVIVFKAIQYKPKSETDAEIYPVWGDVIYWGIVLFPVLFIPVWHILYYCIAGGARVRNFVI